MLRAIFFPIWREWRLFITACGLRALNPTDPRVPEIVLERHSLMERAS